MADICERVGGDIGDIAHGIGSDPAHRRRIPPAGPGYGGSCFPKDTLAMVHMGERGAEPGDDRGSGHRGEPSATPPDGGKVVQAAGGSVGGPGRRADRADLQGQHRRRRERQRGRAGGRTADAAGRDRARLRPEGHGAGTVLLGVAIDYCATWRRRSRTPICASSPPSGTSSWTSAGRAIAPPCAPGARRFPQRLLAAAMAEAASSIILGRPKVGTASGEPAPAGASPPRRGRLEAVMVP